MKIHFFNVDSFCENLLEVSTNKIYAKRGFHPNGLFSEKIFGPVKTCTCGCGIYWGRTKIGEVCNQCGVEIGYSNLRRKKFAKITLPFPAINPIMYYIISKAGKVSIASVINDMIFNDTIYGFYYNTESKKYVKVNKPDIENSVPEIPEGCVLYSGPTGIFELVKFEAEKNKDINHIWKFVYENLNNFFMNNVIVCPPEFRPVSKTKDVQMRDKMNEFYMTILNFSLMLNNDVTTYEGNQSIQMNNFRILQRYIFNFYEYIFSKFSKKTGLIRGSILGKRIDFSARAVICPDPTLKLDECSLPYNMALELFKLNVVNKLLELRKFNDTKFVRYDPAIKYVDKCINLRNFELLDILNDVVQDKLVCLNRQPTLHRMGILSFKIKINTDHVIKIHPMACEPYNADFDGDQMAAYISLYPETEQENRDKLFILNNLISPSTGKMILGVSQDILLGIYLLTKPDENNKIKYNGVETYQGRIEFNKIFPDNFPFLNKTIDKKQLNILLNVIIDTYDQDTVKDIIDNIKELGFKQTTLKGATFSLKNLVTDGTYDIVSQVVDDETKTVNEKFHLLQNHPLKKEIQDTFPYADFINSGSRGSWDQANQLIFCRGYMSNSQGLIVPTPIKHNLIDGLTKEEFFISCYGSRKALLDVALNTAVAGYLTRKLIYCNVNLELNENLKDCGTTDYLQLKIPELLTDSKLADMTSYIQDDIERQKLKNYLLNQNESYNPVKLIKSLINRYMVNTVNGKDVLTLITNNNCESLFGKTIKVRSPMYCKSPRICKTCYGEHYKILHSKYIGIIAAQAMGEVATQLTLRTFHTGGIATMQSEENEDHQDIISDLSLVNKYLHASTKCSHIELLKNLFSIYSRYNILLLVHFELMVSQLMRTKNSKWRLNPNRHTENYDIVSIENIPSKESFLLALAFSKPYNYIIQGIVGKSNKHYGILEKMLVNKI